MFAPDFMRKGQDITLSNEKGYKAALRRKTRSPFGAALPFPLPRVLWSGDTEFSAASFRLLT